MEIRPLNKNHDRTSFDCGNSELNGFLKRAARQAAEKNLSRTFVLVDEDVPDRILGFFSLTSCEVNITDVPPKEQKKYPPQHGLPAVRLARMAVALEEQKKGFGELLLAEAISRTASVADSVGIIGLFVDAKDEKAKAFYQKYGFVVTNPEKPFLLFLPSASLIKAAAE